MHARSGGMRPVYLMRASTFLSVTAANAHKYEKYFLFYFSVTSELTCPFFPKTD
jgi:hypothetical protein